MNPDILTALEYGDKGDSFAEKRGNPINSGGCARVTP